MEATWMSTDTEEWIKMWCPYKMEYYSAIKKNETRPFAETWIDLLSVILSEVRQRRNIIWHLLYMESKTKIQISLQKRLPDLENKSVVARGEEIIRDSAILLNVMCQNGWERGLGENGYMSMYGWIPLLSTWNYHNTVYWLYPNTKCFWY